MTERSTAKAEDGPLGRGYGDACGAAHALELVGERWALLVVRELMLSPKRFTDLRAGLPGLSANVLTQRLEKLEAVGIVELRDLPPPAGRAYALTEWGREAEPILCTLGRWAARSPLHDPTLPLSPTSLILSLRTMFSPARANGADVSVGFIIGRETFLGRVTGGTLAIGPGEVAGADAVLSGTARAIAAAIYGDRTLADLVLSGALSLAGDAVAAARFAACFALPPKAGTAHP